MIYLKYVIFHIFLHGKVCVCSCYVIHLFNLSTIVMLDISSQFETIKSIKADNKVLTSIMFMGYLMVYGKIYRKSSQDA